MRLIDLITDAATGQLSHSKIFNNVAAATVTAVVIWQSIIGTVSDELLLGYLTIMGVGAVASKATGLKLSGRTDTADAP